MGKRANPAVVGAFVVGAVVLTAIAVAAFGSGRLFRTTYPYVLYFTGDVNGLNVGAPVKFKGVQVGAVKRVLLNAGTMNQLATGVTDVRIPVIIEFDAEQAAGVGVKVKPDPATMARLVELGLRAQLKMQSFVTGLLYVKLDMHPGSELHLVADPTVRYPEIPTLPTPLEEAQAKLAGFLAKLSDYDVRALLDSLSEAVSGLDRVVNSPDLRAALEALPSAVRKADAAVGDLQLTLASVRRLSDDFNARTGPLSKRLDASTRRADETLAAAKVALERVSAFLEPNAPIPYQLGQSLNDLAAATRAVRLLAENLERDPSALIRGKAGPEDEQ